MNLYFRLLLILFKSKFVNQVGVLDGSRSWFRAWPFDCDINFHLTNARYFALCDLSRIYYMGQVGVLFNMIKRKWLPVVQAQEATYLKPIKPFQRFEVLTRFSYWENKYWYTEHKFMAGDQLCAVIQVRGVFVQGKNVIPMSDVLALTGEDVKVPDKPDIVEFWKKLIVVKKGASKDFDQPNNRGR
jgi:acyl-CoA thioesterase FadM